MNFKPRRLQPKKDNKCYYSKENFEYPKYVDECTWYAWGRELECGVPLKEMKAKCPTTNAENWYHDSKFSKRILPELADIGVYECGKRHKASDGMGHVFVVEEIFDDNSIRITESGHNMKFQSRIIKYPYKYYLKTKGYDYKFAGFVHPQDYDNRVFVNGKFKMKFDKYVRLTGEVNAVNKILYVDLPMQIKKVCKKTKLGYAKIKTGETVEITKFSLDTNGNTWGLIFGLYWICVRDKTGYQAKRV